MTRVFRIIAIAFIAIGFAIAGLAVAAPKTSDDGYTQIQLRRLLRTKIETISEIAHNAVIISAVRKQNRKSLPPEKIDAIDATWQATNDDTPFKKSLQENEAGRYFQSLIDFNDSIYTEAFLTDRRGANVAAYPITTDYWQGDEEKWSASFNDAIGQVFVGSIEFDQSTKTNAIQISVPVMDEDETIGVLIVGIRLTYVQAKYLDGRQAPAAAAP
jgi:hypothetical protein